MEFNSKIVIGLISLTLMTLIIDVYGSLRGGLYHLPSNEEIIESTKRIELVLDRDFEDSSIDSISYLFDKTIVDN